MKNSAGWIGHCLFYSALLLGGGWAAHLVAADNLHGFNEVRPGIFVRIGRHLELTAETVDQIANTGFIIGSESVAVIDPGGTPGAVRKLLMAIRENTDLPVSHVVVTHVHPDHSFGAGFLHDTAQLVGHKNLYRAMLQREGFYQRRFGGAFNGNTRPGLAVQPDLIVQELSSIDLGKRVLQLRAHTTAHTDHDLSVMDLQTKTLWASDLLFVDRLPSLDGSLPGWLQVMDEFTALKPDLVVAGHGHVGKWLDVEKPQRDYLERLMTEVRAAIAAGRSLREVTASDWQPASHWQVSQLQHATNLVKAYTELEWE